MSAPLGDQSRQFQQIGRGQPNIDLRHLATAQGVGRGAAVGAASGAAATLMRALLFQRPTTSEAHISYVNRCLEDRGYEPIGWQ